LIKFKDPGLPPLFTILFFNIFTSTMQELYILKIKGKARIPDYIQIRDSSFTLKAYFRVDRPDKGLLKCGLENQREKR